MPQTYVADSTGTFHAAAGLWVADATGTYKASLESYIANSSGQYVTAGVGGPSIGSLNIVPGTPAWSRAEFQFSAVNAVSYQIWQVGGSSPMWTGTATDVVLASLVPNTTYNFFVRAVSGTGATADSAPVSWTTSPIPYPTGLSVVSGTLTATDFKMIYNAVADATAYQLNLTSGTVVYTGANANTPIDFPAAASTAYVFGVRAGIGGSWSGWSPNVTVTTPAPPGPAFGAYEFAAATGATWQAGESGGASAQWRSSTDGFYHGNGDSYGSNRGVQTGYFFYGSSPFATLAGGRVTKTEVWLKREDDSGASAAQSCHWDLHPYTGKPSGDPTSSLFAGNDAGSLARGDSGWITIPTFFGQYLVDGTQSAKGIAWGHVSGRYMHAANLTTQTGNGKLRITIG